MTSSAFATVQPSFSLPTSASRGTRTLSKNTSQNSSCPAMLRIGRIVMPGRLQVDEQEADAFLLFRLLVGAHEQVDVRGVVRERGPDFLAVDDEIVAVDHGRGCRFARSEPAFGSE